MAKWVQFDSVADSPLIVDLEKVFAIVPDDNTYKIYFDNSFDSSGMPFWVRVKELSYIPKGDD